MAIASRPHQFSRSEYYAVAPSLAPAFRYELVEGTIYAVSPANPPHAGIVAFFNNRLSALSHEDYQIRAQDVLEIEPNGAPQPDIAVVVARDDFYTKAHPTGADTVLVVEVGDTERKPREKMRAYMRDGRIPLAWRIDLSGRFAEVWTPAGDGEPTSILRGDEILGIANVRIAVSEIFALLS